MVNGESTACRERDPGVAAMNVMISGLTAAGKTTHCRLLQTSFGLSHFGVAECLISESGIGGALTPDDSSFWISADAQELNKQRHSSDAIDSAVDRRMIDAARTQSGRVFDTFGLPFISDAPALRVWLESSLESRVMKAIVSHRGHRDQTPATIRDLIVEKDSWIVRYFDRKYGVALRPDEDVFDLVVDISQFICRAHLSSSRKSVRLADEIIQKAVAVVVRGDGIAREEFGRCCRAFGTGVIRVGRYSVLR